MFLNCDLYYGKMYHKRKNVLFITAKFNEIKAESKVVKSIYFKDNKHCFVPLFNVTSTVLRYFKKYYCGNF